MGVKVKAMTGKQQLFVHEYLKCRHPVEAARKAGYANPDVRGTELRDPARYPLVAKAIEDGLARIQTETVLSAQEVLAFLECIAGRLCCEAGGKGRQVCH